MKVLQTIVCNGSGDDYIKPAVTALHQAMEYYHPAVSYEIKQEYLLDNKIKLMAVGK